LLYGAGRNHPEDTIEDTYEDPLIGQVLGEQYRIEYEIGHGGFGTVYRARQLAVDRDVAVKVLELPLGLRREHHAMLVARFRREAQATSALKHPNTVTLIDFGEDKTGVLFLVLELLEGLDLKSLNIGEAPLESTRVAHIATQICGSLSDAHARGIIHRDLKPANIFVSNFQGAQDFAKVLDFGIARMLDPGEAGELTEITMEGMRIGTPRYMPPEQLRGEPVGAPTDMYALGCIIHEMLTGTPVFAGPGTVQNAIAHSKDPAPQVTLPSLTRDQRDHWNGVLARLLAKRVSNRLQSAEETVKLLKPLLLADPGPMPEQDTMSMADLDIMEVDPIAPPPVPAAAALQQTPRVDATDLAPMPAEGTSRAGSSSWVTAALVVVALLLVGILVTQNSPSPTPPQEPEEAPRVDLKGALEESRLAVTDILERLNEPPTPQACKTSDVGLTKTLARSAALLESGDASGAITELESHSKGSETSAERWALLARARLAHSKRIADSVPGKSSDAKSCETALKDAARAVELCPMMAAPHMTQGRIHAHRAALTEIPEAVAAYDRALALLKRHPTHRAAVLFNQSQLLMRSQPKLALRKLDDLISVLPEYEGARWLRGQALLSLASRSKGDERAETLKRSISDLEMAIKVSPDEAGILFLLATAHEAASDTEKARSLFCDLAERGTERFHIGAKKKCVTLSLKTP
jgi:serine/threonine protein kinase